jgi:hypothetical protein
VPIKVPLALELASGGKEIRSSNIPHRRDLAVVNCMIGGSSSCTDATEVGAVDAERSDIDGNVIDLVDPIGPITVSSR